MRNKRHAFSLIELMLVIALIGLLSAAIGIQLPKAFHSERFEQEVERFLGKLNLAQEIACDTDQDLYLQFLSGPKNLTCIFHTEQFAPKLMRELTRGCDFKEIRSVQLNGHIVNYMHFHIRSGEPQGVVTLQGDAKAVDYTIQGFPGRIKKGHYHEEQVPYPEEILSLA